MSGQPQRRDDLEEALDMPEPPLGNYLPEACKGCVIVHRSHPLIIGTSPVGEDDAPFQWDPLSKVFTVTNAKHHTCFTYVSFCGAEVMDQSNRPFASGTSRTESGEVQRVTTFVIVAEPRTSMRLGRVEAGPRSLADFYALELERLLDPPATVAVEHRMLNSRGYFTGSDNGDSSAPSFSFPLPRELGPYLCTQGVGGHLTHFFPESYHAIDLRCSPRTPVLSIGDGVVKEVAESHRCGGIHAANLAAWNAVSVLLDCGLIVEYLHTAAGSSKVRVGDRIRQGQVLCETGDIGFAPEPHLHIELHDSANAEGPSVPLHFGGRCTFVPVAGRWYMPEGIVPTPTSAADATPQGTTPTAGAAPPPPRPHNSWQQPTGRRRTIRFGSSSAKRKFSKCSWPQLSTDSPLRMSERSSLRQTVP